MWDKQRHFNSDGAEVREFPWDVFQPTYKATRCEKCEQCFSFKPLPLGLAVIAGRVIGQAVQDEDLAPLCALVQGRQQLVDGLGVQVQQIAVGVRLCYL